MRRKTLTKAQIAKLAKLRADQDKAINLVYAAAAPREDVPFWACYEKAADETRLAYDRATKERRAFEDQMLEDLRAHRQGAFGMFTAY